LEDVIDQLKEAGIRVSLFVDAEERFVEGAKKVGADRIEFYTGNYAKKYKEDSQEALESHTRCAKLANDLGVEVNAGHDLNLENLRFYKENVEGLKEVSIGHALISDSLYFGLENTIQMYLNYLR
jgi:pyridoxine 5-phosphate synthase